MEIRSGKDSLKEKLLYIVILFVCLGCIAKMIYDGRMELIRGQLDIGTIGAMLFFPFLYYWNDEGNLFCTNNSE